MIEKQRDYIKKLRGNAMNRYEVSCDFCNTGCGVYNAESLRDLYDIILKDNWDVLSGNQTKCPACVGKEKNKSCTN